MKLLIAFVLALAIAVPTSHGQGRIYNGQKARLGQFPYLARMDLQDRKGKIFSCGGSLITLKYILTAAHCLENKLWATVYLGAIKRYEAEVKRVVSSQHFTIHKHFNNVTQANDIALIKIPPIKQTTNFPYVNLPKLIETGKFANEHVIVTGWGRMGSSRSATTTDDLQWTRLKVLSNEDCRKEHFYHPYITSSNLCANSPISRTCSGDSGGPVVLESTKEQVAIVSWGNIKGCEAGFPSVFVRLTEFLQWIIDNSDAEYYHSFHFEITISS